MEPEGSTPRQGVEEPRGEVDVEPSPKKIPVCSANSVCVRVCVSEAGLGKRAWKHPTEEAHLP